MTALTESLDARRALTLHLVAGVAIVGLLAGGVGGWAATTEIAGAVIAPGALVVDSNVKKVQHPTGGVVGELRVRDGDRVRAGDIVVRLDETVTRANLAIVTKSLDENYARRARLEAERDGRAGIEPSPDLAARLMLPEVARVVAGEERLFEVRRAAREGQKAQLRERVGQLREQIVGLEEQIQAKKREVELIHRELEGVRDLWRKNLVPIQRVTALERDAARLEGERGSIVSSIAQTRGRIAETELQVIQVDQELRTEVGKELADVRGKVSELVERQVTAEDQLKRIDIRAPQDGVVHQLAAHTVGGVVTGGEPIMVIVPEAEALIVEVKIAPQDIDQVRLEAEATLRFTAFNQRTTPELIGKVMRISADTTQDPRTGATYYTVRIGLPDTEIRRLGTVRLAPGMPVEAFIRTDDRTVLSYLTKPLTDQVLRAFREK